MRAGMQCLLDLFGDRVQPGCMAESDWRDLLALGREENLLPWLAARLMLMKGELPGSIDALVLNIRRQAQLEAFAWSAALKELLSNFQERGIPAISLKGPWLAERLYGDTAMRSYGDLDFLVRAGDWNAVEQLLLEAGFSPCRPADDRHRLWQRKGFCVEPHFRLADPHWFDLGEDEIWKRARLSEFQGVPGWLPAPADELRFLCVHAVRHRFERLSLLVDVDRAFQRLAAPDDSACDSAVSNALSLCWMLARRAEIQPRIPFAVPQACEAPPWLEKLADQVWQSCMAQPDRHPDSLGARRFFLRMKSPGWTRLQGRIRFAVFLIHYIAGAEFLNQHDFEFAARWHFHRKWQVRILRPVRLLIEHAGLCRSLCRSLIETVLSAFRRSGRTKSPLPTKGATA